MKLILLAICLVAGVFAEPDSDPKPEGKSEADALAHYRLYRTWPTWYTGYYLTHPYYYGHYYGKRSADSEPEPAALPEADSEALAYYYAHGYTWPASYTGYFISHPYAVSYYGNYYGYLYGRKKRSAEPEAISKADSEALSWYYTYGTWPVGYTGYYYYHPYVLGSYYYGK